MKRIDLHVHTTASDGTLTPEQTVQEAARLGLAAIAVTDHDTHEGCRRAAEEGRKLGVEVVPGIEISTKYGGPVHILGYYIDLDAPVLDEVLDWVVHDRDERNRQICELMTADGIRVDYGEMKARFGDVIGRPHFARILVERGLASDMRDAFDRFVEKGRKYYRGRHFLPIERSVSLIREAGGIPVLAHPVQYRLNDAELRELIEHCMESGLGGIECRYSGYTAGDTDYLETLAREYGLIMTGGSDFHGENKKENRMGDGWGDLNVPYSYLEDLKTRHAAQS